MKVFLSWSGTRSERVAELLKEWLPCVLQASDPWVSTSDIERGAQWFSSIQGQLQETTTGIICLTQENKEKPWILFEAGALAKGLSDARVCTLLIDLEPQHVRPPLGQFNHTQVTKDDMFKLICTLNERLTKSLNMTVLKQVFNAQWSFFEGKFQSIIQETQGNVIGPQEPIRGQDDILAEILEHTRRFNNRLTRLEKYQLEQQDLEFSDREVIDDVIIKRTTRNKILTLFNAGFSITDIGKKLGISQNTASMIINKYNDERSSLAKSAFSVQNS